MTRTLLVPLPRLLLSVLLLSDRAFGLLLDRRDTLAMLQLLTLQTDAVTETPAPVFPDVRITDRVFMDVRIARQDGSFYVRDDLPDTFENRVIQARLTFGLYGSDAPVAVQQFLAYIRQADTSVVDDDVDNPLPSYSRSTFTSLDQETGLLYGGSIPSLRIADVGGASAIRYGKRVIPAKLWIDRNTIHHSTKGLLTHRKLELAPVFGITTRSCPSLDDTHTVFGQLIWSSETANFFSLLQDLPTYRIERPYEDTTGVATAVFNSQREIFRGVAKTFGDTRVDKIYDGKLLRRMEVTQVGVA